MSDTNGKKHLYEYSVDPLSDTAPARVVRAVGQRRKVLEVGSGPGSITRLLYEQNQCRVTALEIDPEALKIVAQYCDRALSADLNRSDWVDLLAGERFETVLAADVLEHLHDPLAALKNMRQLADPEKGEVIVSLPHVGHAAIMACIFDEDFEYRDWGLLDRTHIRFFGIKNIQKLFDDAGLQIVSAEYVIRHPEQTELAAHWQALPEMVRTALSSNPFSTVYQVVVKAIPAREGCKGLSLITMPPAPLIVTSQAPTVMLGSSWPRRLARRYLSDHARGRIRHYANRLGISI